MIDGRGICGRFVSTTGLLSWASSSSESPSELGYEWSVSWFSEPSSLVMKLVPLVFVWMETQLNEGWLSVLTGFIGPGWVRTVRPMTRSGPVLEISGSRYGAESAETSGGPPKQYCSAEHGSPCITLDDTSFQLSMRCWSSSLWMRSQYTKPFQDTITVWCFSMFSRENIQEILTSRDLPASDQVVLIGSTCFSEQHKPV